MRPPTWVEENPPQDAQALELARLAVTSEAIALLFCWAPLFPLIMAYLARDWGREARRRAIGRRAARRALVGMVMASVAVVPNVLLVLLAVAVVLVRFVPMIRVR